MGKKFPEEVGRMDPPRDREGKDLQKAEKDKPHPEEEKRQISVEPYCPELFLG